MPRPDASHWSRGAELKRWPLLVLLLPLLPAVGALVLQPTAEQRQILELSGVERPLLSAPFSLRDGWLGSAELRLEPLLPANTSLALAVSLLDGGDQVLLDLERQGWREVGTWREEGESGTYDERDAGVLLPLRPQRSGPHRLEVTLEDFSDAAGRPLAMPLQVELAVRNLSPDSSLLWLTALTSAILAVLFARAVYADCRQRRQLRIDDHRLAVRVPVAGEGLVRITVQARYEQGEGPTLPVPESAHQVPMSLRLSDAVGEQLLDRQPRLRLEPFTGNDDPHWMVHTTLHVGIGQATSLRVLVELPEKLADGLLELEWCDLLVEDGVVSAWPVPVMARC